MTDTVVWVSPSGGKFHRSEDCHALYIADKSRKTTESVAKDRGYVECMKCGSCEVEQEYHDSGCRFCGKVAISDAVPFCRDCISKADRYDPCP